MLWVRPCKKRQSCSKLLVSWWEFVLTLINPCCSSHIFSSYCGYSQQHSVWQVASQQLDNMLSITCQSLLSLRSTKQSDCVKRRKAHCQFLYDQHIPYISGFLLIVRFDLICGSYRIWPKTHSWVTNSTINQQNVLVSCLSIFSMTWNKLQMQTKGISAMCLYRGFVYCRNEELEPGWVVFSSGRLLHRPSSFDAKPHQLCQVIDPFTLQVLSTFITLF